MPIRENQIFLNNPLSYDSAVVLTGSKVFPDKSLADQIADLGRIRYFVVPSALVNGVTTIFTLDADALGVRVFRNGVEEDTANITHPVAGNQNQIQFGTAPSGPSNPERVEVVYYPVTGVTSNHSDRVKITPISATATLTKIQIADSLVLVTSGGVLSLTMPDMLISDEGMDTMFAMLGATGQANILPGSGDTVMKGESLLLDAEGNKSVKFTYSYEHRDWGVSALVTGTSIAFPAEVTDTNPIVTFSEEA